MFDYVGVPTDSGLGVWLACIQLPLPPGCVCHMLCVQLAMSHGADDVFLAEPDYRGVHAEDQLFVTSQIDRQVTMSSANATTRMHRRMLLVQGVWVNW